MKPAPAVFLRRTAMVAVLTASMGAAAGDNASGWVGKIVPPYPDGVAETSGTCIGDPSRGAAHLCDVSVAVVDDQQSHLRTILLLVQVPHFGKQALWRISDALEPPELDDRRVEVAAGTCRREGRDAPSVVALVRPTADEWLVPLVAWRVDAATLRWEPLAVRDLRCVNEGFGYDG